MTGALEALGVQDGVERVTESQQASGGVFEPESQARLMFKGGTESVSQSGALGRRGGRVDG